MAVRVLLAPLRYVQGPDALQQLGEQLQIFCIKNPLVLAPPEVREVIGSTIAESLGS